MKKIFVGNLSMETTEDALREFFAEHGTVSSVNIITDKFTGKPRGFGFVEMDDTAEADAAIEALNGKELDGRALTVNEARPRADRGGRRGGGPGRGGPGRGQGRGGPGRGGRREGGGGGRREGGGGGGRRW